MSPMILSHLLKLEILELLEAGQLNDVREFLNQQPPPEIAELIEAVEGKDRALLFRLLPRHLADEVFSLLDANTQNLLLEDMALDDVRLILSGLSPDDRTALFEELPAQVTQRLLSLLSDEQRKQSLMLLSYPENSVGRLMTDRYMTVRPEWTTEAALENIRRRGMDSETLAMVYIVDEKGRLVDDLRLRKLILADPSTHVANLLDGQFVALSSLQDQEEAINVFKKYDLYALPVVDADGILLGIVTADDILDVAEEETTEDFQKIVTVRPLQTSLRDATMGLLYRKRIGWLLGLVFVNIFSGAGIAIFEDTIAAVVALVFFLPLLIGSSGNAGAQAATLIVRAMATGEVDSKDWWWLFTRELSVSSIIGLVMAVTVFFIGWMMGSLSVGIVVALSMFIVVVVGSLIGTLLPMILIKIKLDPATASAPLITSFADIAGILIYFSVARAVLGI